MGGIGSGRNSGWMQTTLDDCICLDINRLVKHRLIKDGENIYGTITWYDMRTERRESSIQYDSIIDYEEDPYIRLIYTITSTGRQIDDKICLSRTYPPYGGARLWFICPATGKRVTKLYMLPGSVKFLSRHARKTYYASQLQGDIDRAYAKRNKFWDKVGGKSIPVRPKGMHQKTFDRLVWQYNHGADACDAIFIALFRRLYPQLLD